MIRLLFFTCALGIAAGLTGCADTETTAGMPRVEEDAFPPTRPLAGTLPPVAAPAAGELASMTVRSLLDGSIAHIAIERQDDGIWIDDGRGCLATRPRDWFSPSDSYAGCGSSADWRTATGEVRVLDSLYPLTVGSAGRYWRRAVSATGEVSTRETECAVTDAVAVALPDRPETPAFVVRCDDGRIERTTWYAPGSGPVAYREEHATRGVREAWVRVD